MRRPDDSPERLQKCLAVRMYHPQPAPAVLKLTPVELPVNPSLTTQELAIAIAAQPHNPTIVTPDFLKYSGIVPSNWELAQAPILQPNVAQISFQNGVTLLAQPNRIIVSEVLVNKDPKAVVAGLIARKYMAALPQINYSAIGINFRGFVPFSSGDLAHQYMIGGLLTPAPWQEFGNAPVQAALRLTYMLDEVQLGLEVNEVVIQLAEDNEFPAILFSANFNHGIPGETQPERSQAIGQVAANWLGDFKLYQDLIRTKFFRPQSALDAKAKPAPPTAQPNGGKAKSAPSSAV